MPATHIEEGKKPIEIYELNTVTYGTASAPYLITRVLRQIGLNNNANYPTASAAILRDFYMDDLFHGRRHRGRGNQRGSAGIPTSSGLNLRKWASNEPSIVRSATDVP